MQSVSQARRWLTTIAAIFLIVDIAAAIVLLSPAGRSPDQRAIEQQQLREERKKKEADTRPTRDMDKKLVSSRQAIDGFFKDRLPASYADVSEYLGKSAAEHHVTLSAVRYDTKPTGVNGLSSVVINLSLSGDYLAEMNFINSLEREKKFYVLDKVLIGDLGTNGNQLKVDVTLETFLRNSTT